MCYDTINHKCGKSHALRVCVYLVCILQLPMHYDKINYSSGNFHTLSVKEFSSMRNLNIKIIVVINLILGCEVSN